MKLYHVFPFNTSPLNLAIKKDILNMVKQIGLTNQPLYPTKTFAPQPQKEQPVLNQMKKDTVKFGAGEDAVSVIQGDPTTLAASYALQKIIGSFRLSESEKNKLKEYGMPDEFFKGLNKLKDAEKKDSIANEVREAKVLFESAGDKSQLRTYERASYRMAAISSMLLNEPNNARAFMDKSLNHEGQQPWYRDSKKVSNVQDIGTSVADFVKYTAASPFLLVEFIGQKVLDKPKDTPLTTKKYLDKMTPIFTACQKLEDNIEDRHKELEAGEESDDEWIKGKDRKDLGTSTGKGMRHQIPLVEKQRLAKKDGNDLISGMSKLTLK